MLRKTHANTIYFAIKCQVFLFQLFFGFPFIKNLELLFIPTSKTLGKYFSSCCCSKSTDFFTNNRFDCVIIYNEHIFWHRNKLLPRTLLIHQKMESSERYCKVPKLCAGLRQTRSYPSADLRLVSSEKNLLPIVNGPVCLFPCKTHSSNW